MNVSALMYHDVTAPGCEDSSGFPGGESARYKVTLEVFSDHLRAMRTADQCAVTTDTLGECSPLPGHRARLLLTFDDGGTSAAVVADCLEAFGWRGHFFVTTNYIGRPGFLTRWQIANLRSRGHVVGSHSCSHPLRMARCSASRLRDEWTRSVSVLSDLIGESATVASVPGGDFSPGVADAAVVAGIRVLFTSRPTVRVREHGPMRVLGRFAVRRTTNASVAAAVASGIRAPWLKQLIWWDLRAYAKAVAGSTYDRLRSKQLGRSPDVRWGDELLNASEDPS